jgi:hypothetical protein
VAARVLAARSADPFAPERAHPQRFPDRRDRGQHQRIRVQQSILVSEDGDVIAGHGRLAAARQLGLAEVPVIPLRGLSEVQRRQLVLADNRIALNAGWDMEMLKLELTDLPALGADLSLLGFTKQELADALAPGVTGGLTDENEVPDIAENAISVAGDIGAWTPTGLSVGTAPMRRPSERCSPAGGRTSW